MRVVIDHVAGTRRGQRQELAAGSRVRFGRHPDCEVAFDPQRDMDASSRHAELRPLASGDPGWVLVDLGSSNGTYVDGRRVTESPVVAGEPISVQFGPGGPRIRLFVGDEAAVAALAPPELERARPRWLVPAIVGALVLLALVLLVRC